MLWVLSRLRELLFGPRSAFDCCKHQKPPPSRDDFRITGGRGRPGGTRPWKSQNRYRCSLERDATRRRGDRQRKVLTLALSPAAGVPRRILSQSALAAAF